MKEKIRDLLLDMRDAEEDNSRSCVQRLNNVPDYGRLRVIRTLEDSQIKILDINRCLEWLEGGA